MLLMWVYYFGEVEIAYWEWALSLFYVVGIYIYFARKKNLMIGRSPEYRYFLWALMAKLLGGVVFSLIYFYYYAGGDTISYFYSGVAMRDLAFIDPAEYMRQMFGANTVENWSAYPADGVRPFQYVFLDDRTFLVLRVISLLAILTFKSYLITTLLIASLSFFGIWACYRTFVGYYPELAGKLAIGFLFLPSVVFWSSSILKDTFTFSAVCWLVHGIDEFFFKRRDLVKNAVLIFLSAMVVIVIKPYIFMVLFPAVMLWLFYFRVARLQNALVKFVLIPMLAAGLLGFSVFVLTQLGGALDKFALDSALTTIQVTQGDLLNAKAYSANSFDIGKVDGTWGSALSKFPQAVTAALFRPFLWEARNPMMLVSGLENLWILGLALLSVVRAGPGFFFRCTTRIPLVLMCMVFAVFFAFTVGLTTPNFGALVRFRIPMLPFLLSALYIIVHMARIKRDCKVKGLRFELQDYLNGTAGARAGR